jgi:hypothetical protein
MQSERSESYLRRGSNALDVGERMKVGSKLSKENISQVPRGTVIMYTEGGTVSFGFLVRCKKNIYFRAFYKSSESAELKQWQVRNHYSYTISTKDDFLIYTLENA